MDPTTPDYVGRVKQDPDGRWDWQVLTGGGDLYASCPKSHMFDERPRRRKSAENTVRSVIAAARRHDAAEWQVVPDGG